MPHLIPLSPGVPHYTQRTSLDGREYQLELQWNQREARWYLGLADEHGESIHRCKLVLDWPLLRRVRGTRRPPGSLVAVDATGSMLPPTLDDLGTRVQLVYVDVEELALQNPGG